MNYDYSKLIQKIIEKFGTQANFAIAIDLPERSVSLKLNNKRAFTQKEIEKSILALNLDKSSIVSYFFTCQVQ